MNKYKLIFLLSIFFFSCENETVDVTVMPEATTVGKQTFGCLVDGWLYVGGRYGGLDWAFNYRSSIDFTFYPEENALSAHIMVKPDISISFTIPEPEMGVCLMENVFFGDELMEDCIVDITCFDKEAQIISGEFSGGRITFGRFDVNYNLRLP